MFKPYPRVNLKPSSTDIDKAELLSWTWNSHFWIEHFPGYYKCQYCQTNWTALMALTDDVTLCKENPKIKELLTISLQPV